ncbi:MAG: hypothetical protein RQ751_02280 [Longimicrobiales bacterium]|nr:hypothetical protein [Longimicrobiales bacterium]
MTMTTTLKPGRGAPRRVLASLLALTTLLGFAPPSLAALPSADPGALAPVQDTPPAAVPAGDPVGDPALATGAGDLNTAACIGCLTAFILTGGTSILGVAVMVMLYPEFAAACAFFCYHA